MLSQMNPAIQSYFFKIHFNDVLSLMTRSPIETCLDVGPDVVIAACRSESRAQNTDHKKQREQDSEYGNQKERYNTHILIRLGTAGYCSVTWRV
jgi:hypothetical protein